MRRFADLFAGIGGFHLAAAKHGLECAFACEIDDKARAQYEHALGHAPQADVYEVDEFPPHDLLLAGFPCQAFSSAGKKLGFKDSRGVLFLEIVRALKQAKPSAFVLENVDRLTSLQEFQVILDALRECGYEVRWNVYDARDFGLPQKRRRVWIVGRRDGKGFEWPKPPMIPYALADVLEPDSAVPDHLWGTNQTKFNRIKSEGSGDLLCLRRWNWHDDWVGTLYAPTLKSTGSEPFVWARAMKSPVWRKQAYASTLMAMQGGDRQFINGLRRFTPRELLRLQGFPDDYPVLSPYYTRIREQVGNSLPVPVAAAIIGAVVAGGERMPVVQSEMVLI